MSHGVRVIVPQTPNPGTIYHGQKVTLVVTGAGTKTQTKFLHDYGQAGTGVLDSQWSGGWPNTCVNTAFNLKNQPLSFAPTGASLNLPHNFGQAILAGCHGESGGAPGGYNVNPWVTFTPPAFPYVIYFKHWTRADPNWTFHLGNGEYNYKMYNLSVGSSPYGTVYWYWNFTPTGIADNTTVSQGVSNDNAGGLQSPDANGNGVFWPGNPSVPNHNFPKTLSPFNPSNGTNGWICHEFEAKITSTTGLAALGGGYINWWNQFNRSVAYEGSTDTMSDPLRTFALEGYSVQYPYATNYRYLYDIFGDISGTGAVNVARVVFSTSSTYSDGVARETAITLPADWSSTSIKPTFWQGVFAIGQTVFAHVICENGTVIQNVSPGPWVVIPLPLSITTGSTLPVATAGTPYTTTIAATQGLPPYAWSIVSNIPNTGNWSGINAGTGVLSGTPGTAETEAITIQCADSYGLPGSPVTKAFSLTVNAAASSFDFYVSNTGSDANAGTSGSPWALTALNTKRATYAGKRVGVLPGTYNGLALVGGSYTGDFGTPAFNIAGGTLANPTIIQSTTPLGAVLDAGANSTNNPNGQPFIGTFNNSTNGTGVSGAGYVQFLDFEVKNGEERLLSFGAQTGAPFSGTRLLGIVIKGNYVHDVTNHIVGGNPTGITVYSCNAANLRNNHVTNIGSAQNRGTGIEIWTSIGTITEYNSVISPNSQMTSGILQKNASQGSNTIRFNYVDMTLAGASSQGVGMDNDQGGTDGVYGNIVIADQPYIPDVSQNGYFNCVQDIHHNDWIGIPNFGVGGVVRFAGTTGSIKFYSNIIQRGTVGGRGDIETVFAKVTLMDYNFMPASPVYGNNTDGIGGYPSATYNAATIAAALPGGATGKEAHSTYNNTPGFTGSGALSARYQLTGGAAAKNKGSSDGTTGGVVTDAGAWGCIDPNTGLTVVQIGSTV